MASYGGNIVAAMLAAAKNERIMAESRYAKARDKAMTGYNNSRVDPKAWEHGYNRNVVILSIFILLYLYGSDDGIISAKEKRVFKRLIKNNKNLLSETDYEELIKYSERILNTNDVLEYISHKEFNAKLVSDSIKLIKKYALKDFAYMETLNELAKLSEGEKL